MKKLGLIGYPLEHSFSPGYFAEKFRREVVKDYNYQAFPLKSIKDVNKLLKTEPLLMGFNVTSPYKKQILPFLYEIDRDAIDVWAVNTVKVTRMKSRTLLKGYNTDTYGFIKSISPLLNKAHTKALVLGTGGAAGAAKFCLQKLGLEVQMVSRTPGVEFLGYTDLNESILREYKVVVNATPLGTHPNVDQSPDIPYEFIGERHLCFDMVYNPSETQFLCRSKEQGAVVKNGLEMLELQAEKSWEIWTS